MSKLKYWPIVHPGDLVEIDSKEIRMRHGVILKHFSARDVISRWDVVEVHRRATSLAAARFVDTLLRFPFPVKALQVAGGSEFAAEFELACQHHQLRRWEHTYNHVRPHQSLAYLTPQEFVARWKLKQRKASVTNRLDEYKPIHDDAKHIKMHDSTLRSSGG